MELAEKDLFETMSQLYPKVLLIAQIRDLFKGIVDALSFLHANNVAHNDIKLENIFMFQGGNLAKLADFGFAS